jgi:hypothetical protein
VEQAGDGAGCDEGPVGLGSRGSDDVDVMGVGEIDTRRERERERERERNWDCSGIKQK